MSIPTPEALRQLIDTALDPARSVVVEACAGSGKTWLLAARVVRLLLDGVAPGEILAITFTRKAAREIEERVIDWLRFIATASDEHVLPFLAERGVHCAPGSDTLRRARALFERVLGAQPGLAVNTFHGWFLQLLAVAPLSANLSGTTLSDSGTRQFDEWWSSFANKAQQQGGLRDHLLQLFSLAGADATRRLVHRALARRAEWLAFIAGSEDGPEKALTRLRETLGVRETPGALADFLADDWLAEYHAYLGLLEMSELDTDRRLAQSLSETLQLADRPDEVALSGEKIFSGLCAALLTKEQTLRSRKGSKALEKRFGADGAARFLELHARLGARLLDCLAMQCEERVHALNRHALPLLHAFLAHVAAFKAERRQIDFVDAEWRVLQLLRDDETAAFMQARLDARYRHVLLDEFQDTNPLQWQILLAWLAAYADAARPGIFLVGDPKQSIYRFRRAEPKLFAAAGEFLAINFAAARCAQDTTRRNARPIIDVVNALFSAEPAFEGFRQQHALTGDLPGYVELLPLSEGLEEEGGAEAGEAPRPTGLLRDPLTEPEMQRLDSRRWQEAARIASHIEAMVGHWLLDEKNEAGETLRRPVRYGDIMLLTRSRGKLLEIERALGAAGIPFDAASRGGLLDTLEAGDIVALLEFLVMPAANLALARALRSPILACDDDDLLQLASRHEPTWWQRLLALLDEVPPRISCRLQRAATLLAGWLDDAAHLPAHDLLDRIYHQGEVAARYRLAAPEAARPGIAANLRALLQLSLDLGGGRYPSLPRFIDELCELRQADASEAPDEGAIDSHPAAGEAGRVRILTIHGAKGLEAPIVWLLDANTPQRADEAWDLLVDWPPQDAAPRHFSCYGVMKERGRARQPLFEAEAVAAEREELNLLYVAMTRARQVFIASGIAGRETGKTPYRRLERALTALGSGWRHGEPLPCCAASGRQAALSAIGSGGENQRAAAPLPAIGERRSAPDAASRFGILLHALLERRTAGGASFGASRTRKNQETPPLGEASPSPRGLRGAGAAEAAMEINQRFTDEGHWWRALGFSDKEFTEVQPLAERLLAAPALQRFLDPACYRRAWNEVEIALADGSVRRLDRLVEHDDAFWVLDYKSANAATPRLDEYRAQLAAYRAALAEVFPGRAVRSALVFADGTLLETA